MNIITSKVNWLLINLLLLFWATMSAAQVNRTQQSSQLKNFTTSLAQLNASFTFPEGFKEVKAPNSDAFPFDYAMELPDDGFEVWLHGSSQKDNEKLLADKNIYVANPDSLYLNIAKDQINAFSSDKNYLKRTIPDYILERYNADAGNTYLLNLDDSPLTEHYKYALLIVLQKNKVGTMLAVCFTNEKDAVFFKNMNKVASCLRFGKDQ